MKHRSIYLALLLAASIAIFQGCATTGDLFNKAAQLNTVESYQAFIRENPESPLVTGARARIESLRFEKAKQANTINAYEEFLGQHPGSPYAYEAQARIKSLRFEYEAQAQIETLYFQEAQQTNTIEAYQEYLNRYGPNGRFAKQSQEKIKELGAPETSYVLYFYFAPWCPHCQEMAPVVERFYQEYGTAPPGEDARASLDKHPIYLAARDTDLLLHQLVELPERREKVAVRGIPIGGNPWDSDVENFKRNEGITFPIVDDPGLEVDTSAHPVMVLVEKETKTTKVIGVGEVPYAGMCQ